MKPLNEIETAYWQAYLIQISSKERPIQPFVEASYAGNRDSTDVLLELYLSGKKSAGSSIAEDFISTGDPLPKSGNYWICLDSLNQPRCILKTERVVSHRFEDVPVEIAIAEGEGDLSLEYWKRTHHKLYSSFLSKWGISRIEDATVMTEFFTIVYR